MRAATDRLWTALSIRGATDGHGGSPIGCPGRGEPARQPGLLEHGPGGPPAHLGGCRSGRPGRVQQLPRLDRAGDGRGVSAGLFRGDQSPVRRRRAGHRCWRHPRGISGCRLQDQGRHRNAHRRCVASHAASTEPRPRGLAASDDRAVGHLPGQGAPAARQSPADCRRQQATRRCRPEARVHRDPRRPRRRFGDRRHRGCWAGVPDEPTGLVRGGVRFDRVAGRHPPAPGHTVRRLDQRHLRPRARAESSTRERPPWILKRSASPAGSARTPTSRRGRGRPPREGRGRSRAPGSRCRTARSGSRT